MADLVRWDPFTEFTTLRQAMDKLFEQAWVRPGTMDGGRSWTGFPADVHEAGDDYVLTAVLPGLRPEDVELTVEGNVLTIAGEYKVDRDQDAVYHLRELHGGKFWRQFTLPATLQGDAIEAHMENGILRVRLPKAPEMRARRIDVHPGPVAQIAEPEKETAAA